MISIIIPLYNKEQVITRTINSLLEQDYGNFEIIVVDDGSTDASAAVVQAMDDDRILVFTKKNTGVSDTRNYGSNHASGHWLFFIDADDVLLPGGLRTFINLMQAYPDLKFYTANFVAKEESGKEVRCCAREKEGIVEKRFKRLWQRHIFPRTGAMLVAKDAFRAVGGFRKECSIWEDLEIVLLLLKKYDVAYSPQIVFMHFLDHKELSQKVTLIEKEYAFYIDLSKARNPYHKLMLLELLKRIRDRRARMGDNASVKLMRDKMGATGPIFLFFGQVERYALKFWRKLNNKPVTA